MKLQEFLMLYILLINNKYLIFKFIIYGINSCTVLIQVQGIMFIMNDEW